MDIDRYAYQCIYPTEMRHFVFLICVLFFSCGGSSPEEGASKAAKEYYDFLAEGDAVRFLENKAGVDTLSADYGEQMLAAVRQYQEDIQKKHGGLREVHIAENPGRCDTLLGSPYVHAFLILCYADSTQEEVAVPMVERDGLWLMR